MMKFFLYYVIGAKRGTEQNWLRLFYLDGDGKCVVLRPRSMAAICKPSSLDSCLFMTKLPAANHSPGTPVGRVSCRI